MRASADEFLSKVERIALWGTTFLFPLIVLPGVTLDEFKVPKLAVLVLGVGIAVAARIAQAGPREKLDQRMLLAGALLMVPLTASWLLSDFKGWSFLGQYFRYQGVLPYMLFAVYGTLMATAFKGRARTIAWAVGLAAGMTGLFSVIQVVGLDPLFFVSGGLHPAFSTIGNSNFAGAWHAMAFPVMIGLAVSERARAREIAIALSALIALGILLSFSQGAWIASIGGSIALAGLLAGRRLGSARGIGLLLSGALAILAVASVIAVSFSDSALNLLGPTIQDRAWAWEAAIDSWKANPLIGRGPNTFALFAHEYSPFSERSNLTFLDYRDDPHSVPLFFLASTGILGALGYISAVAVILRWTWKAAVDRADPVTMGAAAGLVAYCIQALVSLDDPTVRLAFWALAGAGLAGSYAQSSLPSVAVRDTRLSPRLPRFGAALLVLTAAFGTSWAFLYADISIRAGAEAALDNSADAASEAFDRGLSLRDDDWYRYVAGKNTGELAVRRGLRGRDLFVDMQDHFASMRVPSTPLALLTEGRLTNAWAEKVDAGEKERALRLLREAHQIDPGGVDSAVAFAVVLSEMDRHREALAVLSLYTPNDPAYTGFWETWALINARAGNEQVAWEVVQYRGLDVESERVRETLELLIP